MRPDHGEEHKKIANYLAKQRWRRRKHGNKGVKKLSRLARERRRHGLDSGDERAQGED